MLTRPARLGDAPAIARVRIESWHTTYRGLLPDDYLDSLSLKSHTRNWETIIAADGRQGFPFVAEDESGQVVGFAVGGLDRMNDPLYQAELYAIYILQEFQGQGLGRILVQAITQRFLEEGWDSMLVWVLSQNPARKFYERLGGKHYRQQEVQFGSALLTEVSYGWSDIRPLASTPRG